jgi:hypothetical protein
MPPPRHSANLLERTHVEMKWNGMKWNGMEWNEMK